MSYRSRTLTIIYGTTALLLIAVLLAPAQVSRADAVSLFGRTPTFADMEYSNTAITNDNRFVIFKADLETDGVYNLYRVPSEGGEPVRLSDPVIEGRGVWNFTIAPNGTAIVYMSIQEVDNRYELYSVPLEGGPPVKLNAALPTGGNVTYFRISPDSSRVVYVADQDNNDVFEVYSVPLAGGAPQKLNALLISGGDVLTDIEITSNSSYVAYRADQEVDGRYELFSVPIAGGTVRKVNGALASGGVVDYFRMHPSFPVVVYIANQGNGYEIFSAAIDGMPLATLNVPLPPGKRVTYSSITPDGSRVLYVLGANFSSAAQGVLYSVLIGGGPSTQLSLEPAAGGDLQFFRITNDGRYTVFVTQIGSTSQPVLYSAEIATGARVPLLTQVENHLLSRVEVSPDGDWVVYSDVDMTPNARTQTVMAIPRGGGTAVQLSTNLEQAYSPLIGPQSDRVLYYGYNPGSQCTASNLYSVQIFGGGRRTLSDVCTDANVEEARWSADGSRIVYKVGYQDAQGGRAGFELFVSDGRALPPTATATTTASATPTASSTPTITATSSPTQTPSVTTTPTNTTTPQRQSVFLPSVQR